MSSYDENARWSRPVVPEDRAPGELERRIGPLDIPYTVGHGLLGFYRRPEGTGSEEVGRCLTYAAFWVPRWPDKDGKYGWGTSPQYAIRNDYGRYSLEDVLVVIRDHAWDGKTEAIIKNFGGTQEAKPMKVSETRKQPDPPRARENQRPKEFCQECRSYHVPGHSNCPAAGR